MKRLKIIQMSVVLGLTIFSVIVGLCIGFARDDILLDIFSSNESLTLYFHPTTSGTIDISDIQIENGATFISLAEYISRLTNFPQADLARLTTPICFHFQLEDSFSLLPNACGNIRIITQQISPRDVFWYDPTTQTGYDLILLSNNGFTICTGLDSPCSISATFFATALNTNQPSTSEGFTSTPAASNPTVTALAVLHATDPAMSLTSAAATAQATLSGNIPYQANGIHIRSTSDLPNSERMGTSQISLYAPSEVSTDGLVVVRIEIDLTEIVNPAVTPPPTTFAPLPTPTTHLRNQRYADVFTIMGAKIEGIDLAAFRISPDPTEQILRLSPGQTNFWEWRLRPADMEAMGTRYLEAIVYVPRVQAEGSIEEDEVYHVDFSIEIVNASPLAAAAVVSPATPLPLATQPLEFASTPAFSLAYNGGESLTFIAYRPFDISDLKIRTASNEEWLSELFSVFDVLTLLNYETRTNMCLIYSANNAADPPLLECNPQYTFRHELADANIFWYDMTLRSPRVISVYYGDYLLDVCSPASIKCDFTL